MRPYIILMVVGVLVAGLAAMIVRSTVPSGDGEPVTAVSTTRIIIASEDIPAGSFVRADKQLTWGDWPSEKVKSPPYLTEETASLESFSGAVARRMIYAGEPISQGAMVKSGDGGFMSAVLKPGARAASIEVNSTTGNAGFIFPGDQVDLILTHGIPGASSESFVSETFVENVRVLAVDQMLDNPENKALLAKTVTLEVTPTQAEAINVAQEIGRISLSLRSLAMTEDATIDPNAPVGDVVTPETLEGVTAAPVGVDHFYPPTANQRRYTRDTDISTLLNANGGEGPTARVRIIRGNETTEVEFRNQGVD